MRPSSLDWLLGGSPAGLAPAGFRPERAAPPQDPLIPTLSPGRDVLPSGPLTQRGWADPGRGPLTSSRGSAQARTGCPTHSGTSPRSAEGETGARRMSPRGVGTRWRVGEAPRSSRDWTWALCLHPQPTSPNPRCPALTSGQKPCIWFSVTIILVMMTKTEVPLGEEEGEENAAVPI